MPTVVPGGQVTQHPWYSRAAGKNLVGPAVVHLRKAGLAPSQSSELQDGPALQHTAVPLPSSAHWQVQQCVAPLGEGHSAFSLKWVGSEPSTVWGRGTSTAGPWALTRFRDLMEPEEALVLLTRP